MKDKNYHKVWDHFHYTGEYRGAAHSVCNLKYDVLKKCFIAFPNGSSNNYRFFIKQLKKQFPIEKELIKMDNRLQKYILHITIYWYCKV